MNLISWLNVILVSIFKKYRNKNKHFESLETKKNQESNKESNKDENCI